jgi:hypothetical protein
LATCPVDPARLAAAPAALGVLHPLPAVDVPPDAPSCGCEWCCCCEAIPLRVSACCSSPGDEACRLGVLLPLQQAREL